ncbi:MAG TPA: ABC transporter permease subunit [Candidatus Saccharimonadia bacterium]|nr:ABC transporter permease subunit [Candidatus Saccharimonadia bacterium]
MKPLIRWGLRMRRASTIWWSIGVSAFVTLEISFFPAFKNQAQQLNQTIGQLPTAVKSLIGDSGNYFSPENYLNSRVFYLVIPILFAILMIGLGCSLLAREEQDGTLELLLSRPVSRGRLLAGKALTGIYISGTIALVSLIVCVGLCKAVGLPNSLAEMGAAMLESYLLCLVFGAFAFMLTSLGKATRGLSLGLTTCLFVGSYVLTGLVSAVDWLKWPARLLPYYYFNPEKMLTGQYAWGPVIGYFLAVVVFAWVGWLGFRRRDIG